MGKRSFVVRDLGCGLATRPKALLRIEFVCRLKLYFQERVRVDPRYLAPERGSGLG